MSDFKSFKEYTLREQAISHELIRRGSLRHLMHPVQQRFYDMVYSTPDQFEFFLYSTRKLGKSFLLGLIGVEHCLKRPDAIVRHVFPQLNTAKETMFVIMTEIANALPENLRPDLKRAEAKFVFPNGAQYILGGAKPENISGLRGPYCTMLLADELCFWHESTFNECLYGTLLAQTSLIPDARLIYASTPPEQISHPSVTEIIPKLRAQQAFMQFTVYDNPMMSPAQIAKQMKLAGGEHTNAWRREYLCELISDESRLVVPLFNREDHTYDHDLPRENELGEEGEYAGLVVADYGIADGTGILQSAYNAFDGVLYVEDEVFEKAKGLRWLDEQLTRQWKALDKKVPLSPRYKYEIIDMFEQAAQELRVEYTRDFRRPSKDKVESQVALVNNAFETGRLKVHKRCKILISMLENGMWKETENARKFERTEQFLHLDLIAALCYTVKACPWRYRPGVTTKDKYKDFKFGRKR